MADIWVEYRKQVLEPMGLAFLVCCGLILIIRAVYAILGIPAIPVGWIDLVLAGFITLEVWALVSGLFIFLKWRKEE